jgi:hypothetical protein
MQTHILSERLRKIETCGKKLSFLINTFERSLRAKIVMFEVIDLVEKRI